MANNGKSAPNLRAMPNLRTMIEGGEPVFAPLVLNPLMARLQERAGFPALYLGAGAHAEQRRVHETIDLEAMPAIDRRTVER